MPGITSTRDNRAAVQTRVDQLLASLEQEKLRLQGQRNSAADINQLAPEVLSRIFELYAQSERRKSRNSSWTSSFNVCSTWRSIARTCPQIWAQIPLTSSPWTKTMLERSKVTPIIVHGMASATSDLPRGLSLALMHIAHIGELRLRARANELMGVCNNLRNQASLLEVLSITVVPDSSAEHLHIHSLFQGVAPRLRRLDLSGCSIGEWDSPIFHGLTHLVIDGCPKRGRPTMYQLADLLMHAQKLQLLSIKDAFPNVADEELQVAHEITLPFLEDLRLEGSVLECTWLLSNLVYPKSANIALQCTEDPREGDDFFGLHGWNIQEQTGLMPIGQGLTGIKISITPQSIDILGESSSDGYNIETEGPTRLSLGVSWPLGASMLGIPARASEIVGGLSKFAGLSSLKTVAIHVVPTLETDIDWSALFGGLPTISVFEYSSPSARDNGIFATLRGDDSACLLLPSLQTLRLRFCRFADGAQSGGFIEGVTQFLALRRQRLRPVKRIEILCCREVEARTVEILEDLVPEVQWDGREIFTVAEDRAGDESYEDEE